jgi:PadR family transcriptional regulator, regulatory protein PadR
MMENARAAGQATIPAAGLTGERPGSTLVPDIETRFGEPGGRWTPRQGRLEHQDLLAGFVRLHILHHAVEGDLYGQWIIEELARHGYKLSPGTLYPMLHAMENKGYLTSREERVGRSARRLYRATPLGQKALDLAKGKLRELFSELLAASSSRERDPP